jgi:hypothetical protein
VRRRACPYVPTRVDDWDIPDPAGKPLGEVREIRDMIQDRVGELVHDHIGEIHSDRTSHQWRLAKLLPGLIQEFGDTREFAGGERGADPRTPVTFQHSQPTVRGQLLMPSAPRAFSVQIAMLCERTMTA